MKKPIYMTWEEIREKIQREVWEEVQKYLITDNQGKLWIIDEKRNVRIELTEDVLKAASEEIKKSANDQKVLKEASQMSLQKKEKRMVINLPEWMKDALQDRAKKADKSMNEIIRTAIADYLSKEKA